MDANRIRPIAICLFSDGGRILVSEDFDSVKQSYFCRPIGGAINFGERSCDAILREIGEEIGAEVENLRLVGVLESLFFYEGSQGHEVVFVYDAEFVDRSLYKQSEVRCYEAEIDVRFAARWRSLEDLNREGIRLVPEGLSDLLK
jgi:8-oxo-dGTP pyrophosphatase MutT (NUDIX family)